MAADFATAGASVIGSMLGYASQQKANQTNLQIARETNELNKYLTEQTNKQNLDIFNRQLQYNSPAEQRKMMEAAGYNAGLLYGNGSNSVVSAPSAPNLQTAHMERAEVHPYLGFSQDLAVLGQNLSSLAQAKKLDAEAKGQEMANEVYAERTKLLFEGMGLDNKLKEIESKYQNDTFEKRIEKLYNDTDISLEQKNELHMKNALLETYGEKEYKEKIRQLESLADLQKEKKSESITQQDLNKKLGQKSMSETNLAYVNAWYQKNILDSEREKNYKTARAMDATAVNLDAATKVQKAFGMGEKGVQILKTLKDMDFTDAAIEKVWKENKYLQKDIEWYEFKQGCEGFKVLSNMGFLGLLLK